MKQVLCVAQSGESLSRALGMHATVPVLYMIFHIPNTGRGLSFGDGDSQSVGELWGVAK